MDVKRKIILLAASSIFLMGAEYRSLHPQVRRELRSFANDMATQMVYNDDDEWGFDRLDNEYQKLRYEFANTNDPDTISYLSVRLANAAMMLRHYRLKYDE